MPTSFWDPFVQELRNFRLRAGSPSYESIARSISAAREAEGMSPYAARVARSTVYDAFRLGRPRVKVTFLRDRAGDGGARARRRALDRSLRGAGGRER